MGTRPDSYINIRSFTSWKVSIIIAILQMQELRLREIRYSFRIPQLGHSNSRVWTHGWLKNPLSLQSPSLLPCQVIHAAQERILTKMSRNYRMLWVDGSKLNKEGMPLSYPCSSELRGPAGATPALWGWQGGFLSGQGQANSISAQSTGLPTQP